MEVNLKEKSAKIVEDKIKNEWIKEWKQKYVGKGNNMNNIIKEKKKAK